MENYPGFAGGISGASLVERFSKQLDLLGIRVTKADVRKISRVQGIFLIESDGGNFSALTVIAATGTRPKTTSLRGSRHLHGSKVFEELADIPLAQVAGKKVIVLGGGDAAFDYSLSLLGRGSDVTIVSRSEPRCLSLLRARADAAGAEVIVGAVPESLKDFTRGIQLQCRKGNERIEFTADYVLMACGREPNVELLDDNLRRKAGRAPKIPETGVPGFFIAGDVVRGPHRQTAIAAGDGVRAAMLVEEYLRKRESGVGR